MYGYVWISAALLYGYFVCFRLKNPTIFIGELIRKLGWESFVWKFVIPSDIFACSCEILRWMVRCLLLGNQSVMGSLSIPEIEGLIGVVEYTLGCWNFLVYFLFSCTHAYYVWWYCDVGYCSHVVAYMNDSIWFFLP